MTIKCITFDVTNTLIKVNKSVGYQFSRIIKKHQKYSTYNLNIDNANSNFKVLFKEQNEKYPGYGFQSSNIKIKLISDSHFIIITIINKIFQVKLGGRK
jgi:FMN phosphatase YigB (HAD superfamily)